MSEFVIVLSDTISLDFYLDIMVKAIVNKNG